MTHQQNHPGGGGAHLRIFNRIGRSTSAYEFSKSPDPPLLPPRQSSVPGSREKDLLYFTTMIPSYPRPHLDHSGAAVAGSGGCRQRPQFSSVAAAGGSQMTKKSIQTGDTNYDRLKMRFFTSLNLDVAPKGGQQGSRQKRSASIPIFRKDGNVAGNLGDEDAEPPLGVEEELVEEVEAEHARSLEPIVAAGGVSSSPLFRFPSPPKSNEIQFELEL
eukprot:CAMPEP_0197527020 /NCGR_PEP_ID=MMETSP1318-20131121/20048_1 /TAXON_ID=552666 /ORGANISM="Partenskyella glossopodia, Strain RCC365" /LENGTH=215 /DNA_ID=CAMNT_0043081447 /DNA_START=238 /DNA_END=885 /DNA_ORIENTATION=+